MSANDLTEADISKMLEERENGIKVRDLCKKYGISDTTYYSLKRKAQASALGLSDNRSDVRDAAVLSLVQSLEVTVARCNTVLAILHGACLDQKRPRRSPGTAP